MKLSGWGRHPVLDCRLATPRDEAAVRAHLADGPLIARGAGRAYGDSALNRRLTLAMTRFDRMLAFDPGSGTLTVEAGVVLGDVIAAFLPRGWFPAVTPGTKLVTIGGLIAADSHGKNHHRAGSFGTQVRWLDLMTATGAVVRCSRERQPRLFGATIGGMGLTGVILRAAIVLIPVETAWIRQQTVAASNLEATLAAFEAARDWTYSVAWIDCLARGAALGRSLVRLGEHATLAELDRRRLVDPLRSPPRRAYRLPLDAPSWTVNQLTVRSFNALYYWLGRRRPTQRLIDWDSYFYPLDALLDWNRIYGRRGLFQFQCVLPPATARPGIRALLQTIAGAGQGSPLAVLKLPGPQASAFSVPTAGYTLALDFPASPRALALAERLDRIVIDHGGRFYLAKDARMTAQSFAASEPCAEAFRALRAEIGAAGRFVSAQSERLGL